MKESHLIKAFHYAGNETGVRYTNRKFIPAVLLGPLLFIIALAATPVNAYYVSIEADILAGLQSAPNDFQQFDSGQLQQFSVSHSATATTSDIYGSSVTTTFNAVAQLGQLSAFSSGSALSTLSLLGTTQVDGRNAEWNDTITITTGGTFNFTQTLTSRASGGPCKSTAQWGIECGVTSAWLTTQIVPLSGGAVNLIGKDELQDGNQLQQTFTDTIQLTLAAGDQIDITQLLGVNLLGYSNDSVSVSATVDAFNTGIFTLDPVTSGASYTTQSGVSYISAIPVPPAVWLFGSGLLGLIGIARRKK